MYDDNEQTAHPIDTPRSTSATRRSRSARPGRAATFTGRNNLTPAETEHVDWIINGDR